jgi:hypothetical protein
MAGLSGDNSRSVRARTLPVSSLLITITEIHAITPDRRMCEGSESMLGAGGQEGMCVVDICCKLIIETELKVGHF